MSMGAMECFVYIIVFVWLLGGGGGEQKQNAHTHTRTLTQTHIWTIFISCSYEYYVWQLMTVCINVNSIRFLPYVCSSVQLMSMFVDSITLISTNPALSWICSYSMFVADFILYASWLWCLKTLAQFDWFRDWRQRRCSLMLNPSGGSSDNGAVWAVYTKKNSLNGVH